MNKILRYKVSDNIQEKNRIGEKVLSLQYY